MRTQHLTPLYVLRLSASYTSLCLMPLYVLCLSTSYASLCLMPLYALHLSTSYTTLHLTPLYVLHLSMSYASLHLSPTYVLRFSVTYASLCPISMSYTSPSLYTSYVMPFLTMYASLFTYHTSLHLTFAMSYFLYVLRLSTSYAFLCLMPFFVLCLSMSYCQKIKAITHQKVEVLGGHTLSEKVRCREA